MKKLLLSLVTVFCAMLLMFLAIQYMPGSPIDSLANEFVRTQNLEWSIAYQRAVNQLNYDPSVPVLQRLVRYVSNIARGNLGQSMIYQRPVIDIVLGALPWTLLIVTFALTLSFTVGILLGIFIAWKRKRLLNAALTIYQSVFGSIPDYIIAYVLVFIFAVTLRWFPSRGPYSSSVKPGPTLEFVASVLQHAVLPVMAYFITTVAGWTLGMRASSLSVLGEDYMNYAVARGLPRRRILTSYLGRNAILPMITSLAISFGYLFGGSPLIENLFVYPGVGFYLNTAVARRDYSLMQGMYFIMIVTVVLAGLLAEQIYTILNPRLRER